MNLIVQPHRIIRAIRATSPLIGCFDCIFKPGQILQESGLIAFHGKDRRSRPKGQGLDGFTSRGSVVAGRGLYAIDRIEELSMKYIPLVLALAFSLSGCDAAKELGAKLHQQFRNDVGPMTYAFVPGYKVTVDGLTIPIYGTEQCPKPIPAKVFVFGSGSDYSGRGTRACVVVDQETTEVTVRRAVDGAFVDEVWRVEVESGGAEKLRLWTPDGKPVVAAQQ